MLFWKYAENLQENTHAEVQFQFPLQLHTSAPEFSCSFTSYFPNAFSSEHLWRTAFLCLKTYFNDAKKWLALKWFARNAWYYFDLKHIFISFYNNVKKSLVKNWFCFYFFLWPLAISMLHTDQSWFLKKSDKLFLNFTGKLWSSTFMYLSSKKSKTGANFLCNHCDEFKISSFFIFCWLSMCKSGGLGPIARKLLKGDLALQWFCSESWITAGTKL